MKPSAELLKRAVDSIGRGQPMEAYRMLRAAGVSFGEAWKALNEYAQAAEAARRRGEKAQPMQSPAAMPAPPHMAPPTAPPAVSLQQSPKVHVPLDTASIYHGDDMRSYVEPAYGMSPGQVSGAREGAWWIVVAVVALVAWVFLAG